MTKPAISVLGAGSWGTALASHLARNGVPTWLWGHDPEAMDMLHTTRCNERYLPDHPLPQELILSSQLDATLTHAQSLIIAVPSHAFKGLLQQLDGQIDDHFGIAWATKGFEPGTGRFLHDIVQDHFPANPMAVITGPSFAKEVMAGLPTAITIHGNRPSFTQKLANQFHNQQLRAYTGNDMLGAEIGGAVKNVLAVATGICDGMQLGLNARAGLITRGLYEIMQLGKVLGAKVETLIGLAGMGDLVLTCTGDLSRNRRLGLALGQGIPLKQAVAQIGQVVESLVTAEEVGRLAELYHLDLPIAFGVRAVLRGELTPTEAYKQHMDRAQKSEYGS